MISERGNLVTYEIGQVCRTLLGVATTGSYVAQGRPTSCTFCHRGRSSPRSRRRALSAQVRRNPFDDAQPVGLEVVALLRRRTLLVERGPGVRMVFERREVIGSDMIRLIRSPTARPSTSSARSAPAGSAFAGLAIIGKLAKVLEVQPAEFLISPSRKRRTSQLAGPTKTQRSTGDQNQ
jgi:hypothetical protein